MDILGALEATPSRGNRLCNLAAFLATIPEDAPGRAELIRLVETFHGRGTNGAETRSAQNMAMVLTQLGFGTTENPVHQHRNHSCRCYR